MRKRLIPLLVLALALAPAGLSGQGFGFSLKAGTTGLGGDLGFGFSDMVGVRGGIGLLPFDLTIEETENSYTAKAPSPQFMALVDFFPMRGSFRLTGGLLLTDDIDLSGQIEGQNVTGSVALKRTQPYLGLGFGNLSRGGVGFVLDLGVGFGEAPQVTLEGPSDIQDEIDEEIAELEEALEPFKYFPVISVGLSIGIGN
jgi:hypothetical protein